MAGRQRQLVLLTRVVRRYNKSGRQRVSTPIRARSAADEDVYLGQISATALLSVLSIENYGATASAETACGSSHASADTSGI